MTTLEPEENTCDVLAVKFICLHLASLIIAKIGRFKPGIRFWNLSWLEIVGGQIADHGSRLVGVAYHMWH